MGSGTSRVESQDLEASHRTHRTRFVENSIHHPGAHDYETIHVGFLCNEHKGTSNTLFIPQEYHEMMHQWERQGAVHGADFDQLQKARERYRSHTRGRGPFSWIYNTVRDFVAGRATRDWDYKHCEIAFDKSMFSQDELHPVNGIPYGADCLVAYGTNMKDGEVFRKPRTFKPRAQRDAYKWIHLRVPSNIVHQTIRLANQEVGKEYDTRTLEKMLLSPVPLKSREAWSAQKWHCTNFTIHILQQAGFLIGMDPNCLNADNVYHFLKGNIHESEMFSIPSSGNRNAQLVQEAYNKLYSY